MVSPQCTEYSPVYSWYPMVNWTPPVYSWYPPTVPLIFLRVLNIPWCTAQTLCRVLSWIHKVCWKFFIISRHFTWKKKIRSYLSSLHNAVRLHDPHQMDGIEQSPHDNYFNTCRQHIEKWGLVKTTMLIPSSVIHCTPLFFRLQPW